MATEPLTNAYRTLNIDTHLPYIYLPDTDFGRISEILVRQNSSIVCDFDGNACYFNSPCTSVKMKNYFLNFTVFDNLNRVNYTMQGINISFVPGS
jgi:hypothetical protein